MKIYKIWVQEQGDTSVFIGKYYYVKAETLNEALMKIKGVACKAEVLIDNADEIIS